VYCKDGKRQAAFEHTSFAFLGFTFRARKARGRRGENFTSFLPAISTDALHKVSAQVRSWRVHLRTGHTLTELAHAINPIVRGWMQYYGAFYRTALHPLLKRINAYLLRWLRKKYKRLHGYRNAKRCWDGITSRDPGMFAHWRGTARPGDQGDKSPVSREAHAGICGSRGMQPPRPPDHVDAEGLHQRRTRPAL
jgi:RNA-directed DNA polymerase